MSLEHHELLIPCEVCGAKSGEYCKTSLKKAFHGSRGWQANPYLLVAALLKLPEGNGFHCNSYSTDDQKKLHIWDDAGNSWDLWCDLKQLEGDQS